jgi:hypothetical protein
MRRSGDQRQEPYEDGRPHPWAARTEIGRARETHVAQRSPATVGVDGQLSVADDEYSLGAIEPPTPTPIYA